MMSNPKHQKCMVMMSNLPDDLLEDIFCRIPATSLKRLRSTCKQWNILIKDKRFTKKHYDKAAKEFLFLITLAKEIRFCSMSVNLNGDPTIAEHSVIEHRFEISKVFHCDGLLLCTNKGNTRIVVWNPCTGQTKWIQPSSNRDKTYTLGSYQDNNSGDKSYKILSYDGYDHGGELEIYEINSNSSWRILDVTPEFQLIDYYGVSLKGKTYWLAWDDKESEWVHFLVSFDYTTEIFERLRVPYNSYYDDMTLSVVREEKLLVRLQGNDILGKEIWVRNKTDEWNKFVTLLDCPKPDMLASFSFLVDEEKKVVMYCETANKKRMVYIAGEDNKVTQVDLGASALGSCEPLLLSYVPSLVRI